MKVVVDFIDNSNIKKSNLNSRGLHLQERGSSKNPKNFLDFLTNLTNLNKVRFALLMN